MAFNEAHPDESFNSYARGVKREYTQGEMGYFGVTRYHRLTPHNHLLIWGNPRS